MPPGLTRKLGDSVRKNRDDVRAIALGLYPGFVFRDRAWALGETPVFAFHTVEPLRFEQQMRHLAENGYTSIDANGLRDVLVGERAPEPKTVALTFDDGRGSLWSVAYPLLKKYGLTGIAFVVPGAIPDRPDLAPSLFDAWSGKASLCDVAERESKSPLCTWGEIEAMQADGVVDMQSHSTYHHCVYVSEELVDFVNPAFTPSFLCSTFSPVVRKGGRDAYLLEPELGRPVYRFGASLAAGSRYVEDEELSESCIAFVRERGGVEFFSGIRWRAGLRTHVRELRTSGRGRGRLQSPDERFAEMRSDLLESRRLIEQRLDKEVRHLCYPWYEGSALAVDASKEAGFASNHWGILSRGAITRVGDDPFYISRINDDYVHSLPGKGRMSLPAVLVHKARRKLAARRRPSEVAGHGMRKIHVLILVDKFDYHGSYINGPAQYYSWLVEGIDRERFEVTLCALRRPGRSDKVFADRGIEVRYLGLGRFDPFTFLPILRLVRSEGVDVLHLTGYGSTTFGRIAAALAGKPAIVHEHWVDPGFGWMLGCVERPLNLVTTRAIAISEYAKQFLVRKKGVSEGKIVVIPNGIPLERFHAADAAAGRRKAQELGLASARGLIGVVGMLHEIKGHRYFLEAARILRPEFPDARFLIIGDGELRSELEAQAASLSLGGYLEFLGHQWDMPAILQMLDLFVITSVSETAPLSLLEAMASGKAIVTTDCGGPSETIASGDTGLVVPVRDPDALARAIGRLLADPDEAGRLGRAARKASDGFSIATTVRRVEALYASLVPDEGLAANT